ncbi:MAG: type II toxin-antitoxin system RelE family toxin [Thermoanaerobaculia bacterium]
MARKQTFLTAAWSEQWKASYAQLSTDRQAACDKAAIALIKRESSPGLHIKPIHPDKHYFEARINSGDRIVFRIGDGTVFFVDVVKHDDIYRYGKRPKKGN